MPDVAEVGIDQSKQNEEGDGIGTAIFAVLDDG